MPGKLNITIENRLALEKRDINVFHHATRSAHIISHHSSFTFPCDCCGEDDYLQVSVASGPGNLWMDCLINLPSWVNFEFFSEGKLTVIHSNDRSSTLLKIPPGPPTWELTLRWPSRLSHAHPSTGTGLNHVTIGDENTAGEKGKRRK